MELEYNHRLSLLNALNSCNDEIATAKAIIEKSKEIIKEESLKEKINRNQKRITEKREVIASFEITQFLAEKQKELIEKAFISNEIDF